MITKYQIWTVQKSKFYGDIEDLVQEYDTYDNMIEDLPAVKHVNKCDNYILKKVVVETIRVI